MLFLFHYMNSSITYNVSFKSFHAVDMRKFKYWIVSLVNKMESDAVLLTICSVVGFW